ncbi:putative enzyme involved in biosynthesis of extracellular polysaccharides [Xenococcus sp. PCC 7305]|uniref:antibiotic biosynthesis monooxygenase family protein n=1 Tax=Xenococcus sp. PCC 7305 TaxID=102125 RepID=UPI0002ABEA96|nr:antibiotic biosynthesis monooxygenase [Xenococcus sp. PCC 7305]ELS03664.1 putative enzyme involved in biosynthesis of extracellular polysaccharides [Xenococcus sp. PCC 7305]
MILEVAILNIKAGMSDSFERSFQKASPIIAAMPGYISHDLQKCLEKSDRYLLLVRWDKLEDHTVGFRQSAEYETWKQLLHHFYEPFPIVEHYSTVEL